MRILALALLLLGPVRAAAGPDGPVDAHAAPATGFSGAYLGMVAKSMAEDPRFAPRLLDSFELHLRSVAAMTAKVAVKDYLELAVVGAGVSSAEALRESLGSEPMEPQRAAALLLAHALSRPQQFREIVDGLEANRAGLGKQTFKLLRETAGSGDKKLILLLRSRGEVKPRRRETAYDRYGPLEKMFDGAGGGAGGAPRKGTRPGRSGLDPARE